MINLGAEFNTRFGPVKLEILSDSKVQVVGQAEERHLYFNERT